MVKIKEQFDTYLYRKKIDKLDSEELSKEITKHKREIVDIQKRIEEALAATENLNSEYGEQKTKREKFKEEYLKGVRNDLDNITKQSIELDNKQAVISSRYKNEIAKIDEELVKLKSERDSFFSDEKNNLNEEYLKEKNELENKIEDIKKHKAEVLSQYEDDIDVIKTQYEDIKNQQASIIASLKEESIEVEDVFNSKVKELEDEIQAEKDNHEKSLSLIQIDNTNALEELNNSSSTNIGILKNELIALNREKEALSKQLEDAIRQFNLKEENLKKDFDNDMWSLKQAQSQAMEKRKHAEDEYLYKQNQYDELVLKLQDELANKNKELSDYYEALRIKKENKNKEYSEVYEALNESLKATYFSKIKEYDEVLAKQKKDNEDKINALQTEFDLHIEELNKQNISLEENKNELISSYEKQLADLKLIQEEYHQKLKAKKEEHHSKLEELKDNLSYSKKQNELEYQENASRAASKLQDLKNEWDQKKEDLLKEIKSEKEAIYNLKNEISVETCDYEDKLSKLNYDYEKAKNDLSSKIDNLNSERDGFLHRQEELLKYGENIKLDYETKIKMIEEEKAKALESFNAEIASIDNNHSLARQKIDDDYHQSLDNLAMQNAEKLDEVMKKHEHKKEEMARTLDERQKELEAKKIAINQEIEAINNEYSIKLDKQNSLSEEILAKIAKKDQEFDDDLASLEAKRLEEEKRHHQSVLHLYNDFETRQKKLIQDSDAMTLKYSDERKELLNEFERTQADLYKLKTDYSAEVIAMDKKLDDYRQSANEEIFDLDMQIDNLKKKNEDITKSNEEKDKELNEKLEKARLNLDRVIRNKDEELVLYRKQRAEELAQFQSSLAASIKARDDAYALEIARLQNTIDLENEALTSEYNQKIASLDEQISNLSKTQEETYEKQSAEYRKEIDKTLSLQKEFEDLKRDQGKEIFEIKQRLSYRQNEIDKEIESLKQGYQSSLDEYLNNYQNSLAQKEEDRQKLVAEIDELKKKIAFENMTIVAYREQKALEKESFANEISLIKAKKNEELALLQSEIDAVVTNFETKAQEQEAVFDRINEEIKKVFEDKPLIFNSEYQKFEDMMNAYRQNYQEQMEDLRRANVETIEELTKQQKDFVDEIKKQMENILEDKNAEISKCENELININEKFANLKAEEATKQSLTLLGIEEDKRNFDRVIENSSIEEANMESEYQDLIVALNSDFETNKLKLQEKMQDETRQFEEKMNNLTIIKDEEVDKLKSLRQNIDDCNEEYRKSIEELYNDFLAECVKTENSINENLEEKRRRIEEKDLLGKVVNPFFSSHE